MTGALVEKGKLGGPASTRADPTKALLDAAETADQSRESEHSAPELPPTASACRASRPTRTATSRGSTRACTACSRAARSRTSRASASRRTRPRWTSTARPTRPRLVPATGSVPRACRAWTLTASESSQRRRAPAGVGAPSAAILGGGVIGRGPPASASRSGPRSLSSRRCPTWCRWRTRPRRRCSSGPSASAKSASSAGPLRRRQED